MMEEMSDKYKGHTPGPWIPKDGEMLSKDGAICYYAQFIPGADANAQLIADARQVSDVRIRRSEFQT
jgi:hypothetical protein